MLSECSPRSDQTPFAPSWLMLSETSEMKQRTPRLGMEQSATRTSLEASEGEVRQKVQKNACKNVQTLSYICEIPRTCKGLHIRAATLGEHFKVS